MIKETPYDAEIKRLEEQIKRLQDDRLDLRQKRAIMVAPFKIGQNVIDNRGRCAQVFNITPSWGDEPDIILQLYKKNGELGLRKTWAYSWEAWRLDERSQ